MQTYSKMQTIYLFFGYGLHIILGDRHFLIWHAFFNFEEIVIKLCIHRCCLNFEDIAFFTFEEILIKVCVFSNAVYNFEDIAIEVHFHRVLYLPV
jgi:hypothetical protein